MSDEWCAVISITTVCAVYLEFSLFVASALKTRRASAAKEYDVLRYNTPAAIIKF